jgi:hypothetical protein
MMQSISDVFTIFASHSFLSSVSFGEEKADPLAPAITAIVKIKSTVITVVVD